MEQESTSSMVTLTTPSDGPQKPVDPTDPTKRPGKNQGKKRPPTPPPPAAAEHAPIAPPVSAAVLKEMRRKRAKKLLLRVLFLVVLPTLLSSLYFGFVATNEYESTTLFVIERRDPWQLNRLLGPIATANDLGEVETSKPDPKAKSTSTTVSTNDALLVKEYVLSREMLNLLDQKVHLIDHYSDPSVDIFSRLSSNASRENAHAYYVKKVSVEHDTGASALTLKVRAFDKTTASQAADVILSAVERVLNRIPSRALEDTLKLTESEGERLKQECVRLDTEIAQKLATTNRVTKEGAPSASLLRAGDPKANLTTELSTLLSYREQRQQRLSFVQERAALLRDELKQNSRYVVPLAGPSEPDEASYPRRGRAVMTTLLFCVIGMGILSLIVSAIREHTNL
jgi:capsular polysaccharide transport system permease protein